MIPALLMLAGGLGALAAVGAAFAVYGSGEEGLVHATRYTARVSLAFFVVAVSASALHRLLRNEGTRWLLRRRRYVGLGFGFAHLVHGAALTSYFLLTPHSAPMMLVVAGGFGYVILLAMMATSNNRSARALGRNWRRLHLFGVYYLGGLFAYTFAGSLPAKPAASTIGLLLLAGALALRAAAARRRAGAPAAA